MLRDNVPCECVDVWSKHYLTHAPDWIDGNRESDVTSVLDYRPSSRTVAHIPGEMQAHRSLLLLVGWLSHGPPVVPGESVRSGGVLECGHGFFCCAQTLVASHAASSMD